MKRLSLTLAICGLLTLASLAQEVTLTTDTLDEKVSRNKYKYQSFDQYDQKFLIKLGTRGGVAFDANDIFNINPFDFFAFEYLLTDLISIEGAYIFPLNNWDLFPNDFFAFSMRLRRYLKRGRLANNLSGPYVGLEYANFKFQSEFIDQGIFLQFGKQIKKSRFGYADFRLFTGYQFNSFNNSLNLGFDVTVGAAWGPVGARSKQEVPNTADFSSHKEHVLITLENPRLSISDRFYSFSLASTIEKEIFIEGLTFRSTIGGSYSWQNAGNDQFIRSTAFSVSVGARKYFGLFRKPHADDPIHSFAGFYIGTGIRDLYSLNSLAFENFDVPDSQSRNGFDRETPFISVGYQERLGRRFFYDLFITYSFHRYTEFTSNRKGDPFISYGTRVGLNWGQ